MADEFILGIGKAYGDVDKLNKEIMETINLLDQASKKGKAFRVADNLKSFKGFSNDVNTSTTAIQRQIESLAKKQNQLEALSKKELQYSNIFNRESKKREAQIKKESDLRERLISLKERENKIQSKQMTGRMVEYVNSIGKANDGLRKLNMYYSELESKSNKIANAESRAKEAREKAISAQLTGRMKEYVNSIGKTNDGLKKMNAYYKDLEKSSAKAFKNSQAELAKTQGLYNKVQTGVSNLSKRYNDLALRKELNGKLTIKEQIELTKLETKLNKYSAALNRVDSGITRHSRSLTRSKRKFDSLGFSIAQITREAPAFLISMNTGFMAISNNLPILVDEIEKLRIKNKELNKTGQKGVPIWKSLVKGLFSWQSAVSLGIVLLTAFGGKIIEWIKGEEAAEKATKKADEALKEQNKSLKENLVLRQKILDKIKGQSESVSISSVFGGVLDNMTENTDAAFVLLELAERLNKAGIEGADILKNQDIAQSERVLAAKNILKIEQLRIDLENERLRLNEANSSEVEKERALQRGETLGLSEVLRIQKEINKLQSQNKNILENVIVIEKDISNEKEKQRKFSSGSQKAIDAQIAKLTDLRDSVDRGTAKWAVYDYTLKLLQTTSKALNGDLDNTKETVGEITKEVQKSTKKFKKFLEQAKDLQEQLKKELGGMREGFMEEFFSEAGFDFTGDLLMNFDRISAMLEEGGNKWQDYFNVITEVGQEAFNFLAQNRDAHFQAEYERLEQQKEVALQFAGESTAAKERIEEQYEAKRKEIQTRQARAQKQAAIVNATINTAQAVVSVLAQEPGGLIKKSIAAAIVGAMGAAQVALIASQQIPEFKHGVRDFKGGLAVVGDGGKSEIVRTNDGIFKTPSTDTLVNLPKGADVFSSEDAFLKELTKITDYNGILFDKKMFNLDSLKPSISIEQNGISAREMNDIMSKQLSKLEMSALYIDEKGFTKRMVKGYSSTVDFNNRVSFRGKSV